MRGQTTLDFAIGVSIFLAVVLFTFAFVPTVLDPFDVVAEESPALVDRTADDLVNGRLGSPEQPHDLDRYCTVAFFADESPSDCDFDGSTLEDRLNLDSTYDANVTITQDGDEALCWSDDAGGEPGLTTSCGDGDTTLAAGVDRPTSKDTTISARRTVSLAGETVQLEVVLW